MKKTLNERIKELRLENGWSQTDLAVRVEVTQQTIADWEKGKKPSIDKLILLARAFNASVDFLLGLTDKKGIVLSVNELKERHPEIADKLDALEVDYLNWEADVSEEQLIKIAKRTLDRAIKKMEK